MSTKSAALEDAKCTHQKELQSALRQQKLQHDKMLMSHRDAHTTARLRNRQKSAEMLLQANAAAQKRLKEGQWVMFWTLFVLPR